jgi:hypothetical protein
MRVMRARAALVALVVALWSAAAAAQPGVPPADIRKPLLLQLDGVVSPERPSARQRGFALVSLGFLGESSKTQRWLDVVDARTLGGDQSLDGKDVLNALAPFTPHLLVAGPQPLVARLLEQPSGTRVVVEGLIDRGSRTYYLRSVETRPETPTPPT